MQAHESDFAGAGEEEIVPGVGIGGRGFVGFDLPAAGLVDEVGLGASGGEEAGADHGVFADEDGDAHGREVVVADHEIECVACEGLVEEHAGAGEDVGARSGDADAACVIDEAEVFAEVDVVAGLEAAILLEGFCEVPGVWRPSAEFDVVVGRRADGDIGIRRERDAEDEGAQFRLDGGEEFVELLDLAFEACGSGFDEIDLCLEFGALGVGSGFLEFAGEFADLRAGFFGEFVLLGASGFLSLLEFAAAGIEFEDAVDVDTDAFEGGTGAVTVGMFAQVSEVDHGRGV